MMAATNIACGFLEEACRCKERKNAHREEYQVRRESLASIRNVQCLVRTGDAYQTRISSNVLFKQEQSTLVVDVVVGRSEFNVLHTQKGVQQS